MVLRALAIFVLSGSAALLISCSDKDKSKTVYDPFLSDCHSIEMEVRGLITTQEPVSNENTSQALDLIDIYRIKGCKAQVDHQAMTSKASGTFFNISSNDEPNQNPFGATCAQMKSAIIQLMSGNSNNLTNDAAPLLYAQAGAYMRIYELKGCRPTQDSHLGA